MLSVKAAFLTALLLVFVHQGSAFRPCFDSRETNPRYTKKPIAEKFDEPHWTVVKNTFVGKTYDPVKNTFVGKTYDPVKNTFVGKTYDPVKNTFVGKTYDPVKNTFVGKTYDPVKNTFVGKTYDPVKDSAYEQPLVEDYDAANEGKAVDFFPKT